MLIPLLTREHETMKSISLVLLIAAFIALPRGSSAATREDLIESAKKEREVVFYTTTNIEEAAAMSGRFKAKYPFLDVNINRAEGERIVTKVLQETRAKKSLVDVMQTPAFYLHALKKRGILGEYSSPRQKIAFTRGILKKRNPGPRPTTIHTSFFTTPSSSQLKTCRSGTKIC